MDWYPKTDLRWSRVFAGLALPAVVLIFSACNSGAGPVQQPVPVDAAQLSGFAAPGKLIPSGEPRSASYIEADLQQDGAAYDMLLPSGNVVASTFLAIFTPEYAAGDPLADAAFAIYQFDLPGYDRNPEIKHGWSVPPPAGTLYFGLADWEAESWRWFEADPSEPLILPQIDSFIRADDGRLALAVLLTGDAEAQLGSLRIGSFPPTLRVASEGLSGFVPFQASIDASASSDPDGELVKFEWDLDDNGSFEIDSGLNAVQTVEVDTAGAREVNIRLTDDSGISITGRIDLSGFDEWVHSWGGLDYEDTAGVVWNGSDAIYVAGLTQTFGNGGDEVLLLKYNLAGDVEWARTWGTAGDEDCWGLDVDSAGQPVVLCQGDSAGAILLKFDSGGNLLWSKEYTPLSDFITPSGLQRYGDDFYFGGFRTGVGGNVCLARIDTNGNVVWVSRWTGGNLRLGNLQVYQPSQQATVVAAAGEIDEDVFLLRLNHADGSLFSAESWGGPEREGGRDVAAQGPLNPQLWISGFEYSGDNYKALLVQSGGTPIGRIWDAGVDNGDQENATGIELTPAGDLLLGGFTTSFNNNAALLLRFDNTGALLDGERLTLGGSDDTNFNAGIRIAAGVAVLGSGWCDRAQGATWLDSAAVISPRNFDWQAATGTLSDLSITAADVSGTVGTPVNATIDSGGGGGDFFVSVRALP